jgi:hypothetical protein
MKGKRHIKTYLLSKPMRLLHSLFIVLLNSKLTANLLLIFSEKILRSTADDPSQDDSRSNLEKLRKVW